MTTKTITQGKILDIFEILFGDSISVNQTSDHLLPAKSMTMVRFVYEDGHVCGWLMADAIFAAGAGGALTMIPADVVNEAIKQNALSGMLLDNFSEIANICSSLFQSKAESHVKLDKIGGPAEFPEFSAADPNSSSSFEVRFPRLGAGRFTIAIL